MERSDRRKRKTLKRFKAHVFAGFFLSAFSLFLLCIPDALAKQIPSNASSDVQKVSDDYKIGLNDVLEISVYEEPDLTQEVMVNTSGAITYPLLGRVKVVGLTVTEMEDFIRKSLAKDYIRDPQVKIFVKQFSNLYVMGEVKNPGPLPFDGGMTILQTITKAGGFSDIANKRKVKIVPAEGSVGRKPYDVNVNEITRGKREDERLQPGDTIIVSESFF